MTTRSIKKYSFQSQDLESLRSLGDIITNPASFQSHHGKLLKILNTKLDEGILKTLVQFYDPRLHCFTFPDYQLVPTLEEYSYLVGLPILDIVPFSGLEGAPKASDIAKALHLKISDITDNLTTKGKEKIQGITSKFLISKANIFVASKNTLAFESILALLVYGLLLFPNVNGFVDANAIQIFLTKNPVSTLLADTYHSIHHRTDKQGGTILVVHLYSVSGTSHTYPNSTSPKTKLYTPKKSCPLLQLM
jgi:hypothetical protein